MIMIERAVLLPAEQHGCTASTLRRRSKGRAGRAVHRRLKVHSLWAGWGLSLVLVEGLLARTSRTGASCHLRAWP